MECSLEGSAAAALLSDGALLRRGRMAGDKRRQVGPRSCQVSWDDDASTAPANSPPSFVFPLWRQTSGNGGGWGGGLGRRVPEGGRGVQRLPLLNTSFNQPFARLFWSKRLAIMREGRE